MDVRYTAWAGYDLLGTVVATGTQMPPGMSGKTSGGKKIKAKEIAPSMRGAMSIQNTPRVVHDNYRPFPGPSDT
jgi:hypothetical protein